MIEYYLIFLVITAWLIFRLFFWQRKNYGYECPHCHAEFQPTGWLVYLSPHVIFRRYVRCPQCHKTGWASVIHK
jgi:DNA-directed RNA polymerase subunit RPC12/RpoP